ncbi:glucose-6-phosphate isomerase [Polynucleobacter paneuropaeus]|jgi:glucose-6-phosphate isomerase|uniref:Glucose-6-phosphate isomerase n=1 Tax=Polynucleobacter paneuropaeus TaxID=2527775 RepID=A0ABX9FA12_9BURK|nr:glucose-6-phosphate isomerase [Polynucleobacter paneuropaeus]AWW48164.1 glucose-6-phosphate isomerase [Polynucleobacter paneuropaeus]MBT8555689.1 glucose-6-phosphate isomerase [Polynucleobacter paneuropaeus]MBT8557369.1 glucose-6-phosphate isomerase [Polynucleobacter paneuropaeus]MBT8563137.1 glucose-6-phosphate isomerase [Polynucleobacter paneuropaeus]MBT8564686.1 glucose-6-phosphate isomerase [Polynucleobacter paneuropaeus]
MPSKPSANPIHTAVDVILDTAYQGIDAQAWDGLFAQAHKSGLEQFITDLFAGKHVNASENRAALHSALRNLSKSPVLLDGEDVMPAVSDVWRRIDSLCNQWVGVTDVIHIGIGGSDFGPRLAIEALSHVPGLQSRGMRMHFLSNIDTAELARILQRAQPNSTRVIIVSKSFTTLETTMNAKAVVNWLKDNDCTSGQIAHSLFAVTANIAAAKTFGIEEDNIYPFWDWVGGRYSVWSAVGLPIALQYGFKTFQDFLAGAHAMDLHFRSAPLEENLPVIMALALLYQQQTHDIKSFAAIPYADALDGFPKWLQQLDMESNGKRVGRDGKPVKFSSPVVFGSSGSNAQHSYFQLFHQGTETIPIDFIAVRKPMSDRPEAVAHHRILMSNCLAQAQALAHGKDAKNPNEVYPGKRPSNLLLLPELNAFYLGALLALYENRTVALGALWNINSFDQPGVELGKVLAKPIEQALASGSDAIEAGDSIDDVTAARINYLNS